MLKSILSIGQLLEPKANSATLKMVAHDRTAGSMPVWEKNSNNTTAKSETEQRFAEALTATEQSGDTSPYRMALVSSETNTLENTETKPFGFGDLIDIVNPLHHIPVVGSLYRSFSGDTIRGPGRIIGGAVFGGPLGAAASMVNMLVEYDTGRDITEHAFDMTNRDRETPETRNIKSKTGKLSDPQLNQAILAYQASPGNNADTPYIRTMRL